jgi:predicted RNase H-like HicB family nuclease
MDMIVESRPGSEIMEYIAYLHKDCESDYGVGFPDFPGCVTAGKTLAEACRMAAEALALHIQGMMKDGDVVPEPSRVDDIAEEPGLCIGRCRIEVCPLRD